MCHVPDVSPTESVSLPLCPLRTTSPVKAPSIEVKVMLSAPSPALIVSRVMVPALVIVWVSPHEHETRNWSAVASSEIVKVSLALVPTIVISVPLVVIGSRPA